MDKQMKSAGSLQVSRGEVWVMGRRPFDVQIIEFGSNKPEVLVCISPEKEMVVGAGVIPPEASDSEVISWALECMLSPMMGNPRRPESIILTENRLDFLAEELEKLGIDVSIDPEPNPAMEMIVASMENEITGTEVPPYLAESGLDPNLVGEFFQAAADFYKIKPWKMFEAEVPIRISLQMEENRDYWAVVMGMGSQEFGLSMYRSAEDLLELFDSEDDEAMDTVLRMWTMGFSYDKVADIGEAAQAEYKFNKWTVAGRSAYPVVVVADPESKNIGRMPNNAEMKDLVAVIRALNVFLKAHKAEIEDENIVEDKVSGQKVLGKPYTASIIIPAPEFILFDEDEDEEE